MAGTDILTSLEMFRDFNQEERETIYKLMKPRSIVRGDDLIVQGQTSGTMFIVLYGAFDVHIPGNSASIARIGAGEVIGEIGFLAGTPRTATVTAIRDAMVLELDRAAYEHVVKEAPSIQTALLSALARRLGDTSAKLSLQKAPIQPRTIAIVSGGGETVPPLFFGKLKSVLRETGASIIDRDTIEDRFYGIDPDSEKVRRWLNEMEWDAKLLVYFADPELSEWTRKCIRQADLVVVAVRGEAPAGSLNPVEEFISEVHPVSARRLVRVHDKRTGTVTGTAAWLDRFEVFIHHHLSLEDERDFHSLSRFLHGRAVGFAAGGGGAFGPAHVGIGKAFLEHGVTFDIFVGTSVGAAITAGFAINLAPEEIDQGTHDIFITNRGFKRPTWPRYALLDHKAFDEALARNCGIDTQVEDCWHPFFAVATNLSGQRLELLNRGSLWKAVRASASIPGILPPVFTDHGTMLVDGGVMDNAPLVPLKSLKTGPNLVVHFGKREERQYECRYEEIPGRWELIASLLNPVRRRRLPRAPGAASVLMRSMMAHQHYNLPSGREDLVLQPPPFPGSSFMNFDHHEKVFRASYDWALELIDELKQNGDPAVTAIINPLPGL